MVGSFGPLVGEPFYRKGYDALQFPAEPSSFNKSSQFKRC